LTIFQKVCDAAAYAHSKGVVHRDLKPPNIMVGDYGEVLVMDWGLAKIVEGGGSSVEGSDSGPRPSTLNTQPGLTLAGSVMGSPQFMAPEQAAGKLDEIDARTDIFALGGILYNILTLHPPISVDSIPEMLRKIQEGEILPPTAYNTKTGRTQAGTIKVGTKTLPNPPLIPLRHCPAGRIPESLAAVAMQALALRREDRYQSVTELQQDIEAYQGGFATRAENASAWRQAMLLVKRHKKEFALAAVALVVLVATVTGFLVKVTKEKNLAEVQRQRAEVEKAHAQTERDRAETEKAHAQTERDRAEKTLVALHDTAPNYYEQAQVMIEQRQWPKALERASIAVALAPEVADYHVMQGNLLQAELRIAEAREAYAAALQRQPDHKVAKANLELCQMFLREEDGQHPYRTTSLTPIQRAMFQQGRTAEAGAFTRFIEQSATNQVETLTAWSNVMVRAGFNGSCLTFGNDGLAFSMSGAYTNETLAVFQGMPLNYLFPGDTARKVRDLRPLQGMPLHFLTLHQALITDLNPLQGMQFRHLDLAQCMKVTDLTPLRGMPLEFLAINAPAVSNLSVLQGMPLTILWIGLTKVSDLTPLAGLRLTDLDITGTEVSDLTPLRGMRLTSFHAGAAPVSDLSPLKGMPLESLQIANTPVKDISLLRGMPLTHLDMGVTGIDDLTPLTGLPLKYLNLNKCPVTDLSPLRGMPLQQLYLQDCAKLQDLTSLADCLQLETLIIPATCKNIECLRSHPKLKWLGYTTIGTGNLAPTVAGFWKAYDAQTASVPAGQPTP